MNLSKQYNRIADKFSDIANADNDYATSNRYNREIFYDQLGFLGAGTQLLDIGCGDGTDMLHYKDLGANVHGLDASEEMINAAQENLAGADLRVGVFENMPFKDSQFDVVVSKYALQTSANLKPIFEEIHRVLKPGGVMLYLVTHPFRQYFERKDDSADYFEQEIVDSNVFDEQITFKEPTHTMQEYFSQFVLKNFKVDHYEEHWEPCAEHINGRRYPGFFIAKATKL